MYSLLLPIIVRFSFSFLGFTSMHNQRQVSVHRIREMLLLFIAFSLLSYKYSNAKDRLFWKLCPWHREVYLGSWVPMWNLQVLTA